MSEKMLFASSYAGHTKSLQLQGAELDCRQELPICLPWKNLGTELVTFWGQAAHLSY